MGVKNIMSPATDSGRKPRQQYGALPLRRGADGDWQILLVTTRGRRLWSIPKGWPIRRLSPSAAAAQEAFEEGGVRGSVEEQPAGRYRYEKRTNGSRLAMVVDVYRLVVSEELESWPEKAERIREWVPLADASARVAEPELAALLKALMTMP